MRRIRPGAEPTQRQLEALTAEVPRALERLSRRARPFIVEFAGMPRAGKSSCIETVAHFLRSYDFTVHAPPEGASLAPRYMKTRPSLDHYNLWTMCHGIVEILEGFHVRQPHRYQFVFLDRGLFDAICWFSYLTDQGLVSRREFDVISRFLRIPTLNGIIDLVLVFTCAAERAAERESQNRLIQTEGREVTNQKQLAKLRATYGKWRNNSGVILRASFGSIQLAPVVLPEVPRSRWPARFFRPS